MKTLSKAGRLGKQFKRFQIIVLILAPSYFLARMVVGLIFNV